MGLAGLTEAEYFRDQGQDVLLFIDNIFRFTQAGSEVSALLGRMPVSYTHLAISRPPCSANAASSRAKRRTPTAPAASCSCTPASMLAARSTG